MDGLSRSSWAFRATAATAIVGAAYAGIIACSSARPSSWPNRTATPIQQGMITPISNADAVWPMPGWNSGGCASCGWSCPLTPNGCGAAGSCDPTVAVVPPCVPIGRCITTPLETCAGSTGPHFCWMSIPQASEYTIVVQDESPTPRVVWAWTFHFTNPNPVVIGAEYGKTCSTPNPTAYPLSWGGPYQPPNTPTYNMTTTPPPPTPLPPKFRWGVVARIDNQYFALGGPWEFVAAPP